MMNKYVQFIFIVLFSMMSAFSEAATSDPMERTKGALNMIQQIANDMCEQVPLNGSQQNWELSGEMKVKLSKLLKVAADAGFSGAAKYKTGDYSGLLQRDLLAAQKNRNECRQHYFDGLKDKLLSPSRVGSSVTPANSAKVSLTIDDFSHDDKSRTLQLRGVFSNTLSRPVTVTAVSFSARHEEHEARLIIAEPQWSPLSLSPNTATPYSFAVPLSARDANAFTKPANLPEQIFIDLRAVDSNGNASETSKHFMTLNYSENCRCVIGTLFAMPHAILKNTTPIYKPGKDVYMVAKAFMPVLE